jgi:hypothetical protein
MWQWCPESGVWQTASLYCDCVSLPSIHTHWSVVCVCVCVCVCCSWFVRVSDVCILCVLNPLFWRSSPRQTMKTIEHLSCYNRWVKVLICSQAIPLSDIDSPTHCLWSCYCLPMTSSPVHCSASPLDEPLCDSDQRESDSICEADDMQPHVTFLSIYIFSWKWRTVWVSEVATDSRWLYLITGALGLWVRNSCLTYLHHNYTNRTQHFRAHMYVLALKRIHMNRTQHFRAHIYVPALKGCSLHIPYIFSILMTILSDDLLIRKQWRNGFSIKLIAHVCHDWLDWARGNLAINLSFVSR